MTKPNEVDRLRYVEALKALKAEQAMQRGETLARLKFGVATLAEIPTTVTLPSKTCSSAT